MNTLARALYTPRTIDINDKTSNILHVHTPPAPAMYRTFTTLHPKIPCVNTLPTLGVLCRKQHPPHHTTSIVLSPPTLPPVCPTLPFVAALCASPALVSSSSPPPATSICACLLAPPVAALRAALRPALPPTARASPLCSLNGCRRLRAEAARSAPLGGFLRPLGDACSRCRPAAE